MHIPQTFDCFIMKIRFLIVLLHLAVQASAQQIKLVSDADGSPVAFASAFLTQTKVGTISDENGILNIDITSNDTLVVKHLGFEHTNIPTTTLHNGSVIRLKPTSYTIDEVMVKSLSALQLVKKAKEFISVNYPISLSRYNMSVENLITAGDSIYCCLRGSVICTSHSYSKDKPCEYRLVQADTYVNRRADFCFFVYPAAAYPANLIEQMHLTNLDFIKNTGDYQYSYAQTQGQGEYVINFNPKKVTKRHFLKGSLVINMSDMAIKHIEYTTAAPDVVAYDEKVVELSLIVRVYSNGKHYIKLCKTTLDFEKVAGYYQLTHAENKYDYKYVKSDGREFFYSADNSIVNHFGDVPNVDSYKQIKLYGYDLTEWKRNSIKRDYKQKYLSRKISNAIQALKEKYPDMDFSEIEKEME